MIKLFFLLLLSVGLASCYPPRIIYTTDDIQPQTATDSVEIQLLKGSTISIDAQTVTSILSVEILNNRSSSLSLNNSKLEAIVNSNVLNYNLADGNSLPLLLEPRTRKNILLTFKVKDPDYRIFGSLSDKNKHSLKLNLTFQNGNRKITKLITLKYLKKKRFVFENERK
ncbi:MAG: hypothetical protein IKR18_04105 [Bacteroidaceae bacterium]|nr:hypothetical protein [Bacteroidaceae bacterium]